VKRWVSAFLIIVVCSSSRLAVIPARAEEAPARPAASLWENAGGELLAVAAAPVQGSWPGYAAAAAFGGALAVALQHDPDWYRAVQDRRNDWQDKTMPVASLLGDGWFHVGAYAALYALGTEHDQRAAAAAVEGEIGVAVVSVILKEAFSATRPGEDDASRHWFTGRFGDASFPSGHAMTAFCAAAILGDAYHAEWLAYPLAGLVAYSRVYNQKHWPSDVIAGAGLGLLIGQTVVAWHAGTDTEPAVRFLAVPQNDGAKVVATWRY
jgi:membrane-associated phospholipid phosphatase